MKINRKSIENRTCTTFDSRIPVTTESLCDHRISRLRTIPGNRVVVANAGVCFTDRLIRDDALGVALVRAVAGEPGAELAPGAAGLQAGDAGGVLKPVVQKMMNLVFKNDEPCMKMINFVLKMINFVLKMMSFAPERSRRRRRASCRRRVRRAGPGSWRRRGSTSTARKYTQSLSENGMNG